ncbi:MAG: hypothetical protein G8345_10615, partial [Magnetococcales bacterium]|nr:hypothetical protein [Magnetococcales bacterium]
MAITSLAASQTAYQRTNQLQNVRNPPTRPEKGDGSPVGNGMGVSKADFLTISDPVAFANRVLQDKVVDQLNAYLAETPNTELIGDLDPNRVTPEGTAKFIVDMATSFYGAYAENHKEDG